MPPHTITKIISYFMHENADMTHLWWHAMSADVAGDRGISYRLISYVLRRHTPRSLIRRQRSASSRRRQLTRAADGMPCTLVRHDVVTAQIPGCTEHYSISYLSSPMARSVHRRHVESGRRTLASLPFTIVIEFIILVRPQKFDLNYSVLCI